jgi:hypothetical protein
MDARPVVRETKGEHRGGDVDHGASIHLAENRRIMQAFTRSEIIRARETPSSAYLPDRALSRLLRGDWPGTLDGWEDLRRVKSNASSANRDS